MSDRVVSLLPKGTGLGRYVQYLYKANGDIEAAREMAERDLKRDEDPKNKGTPRVIKDTPHVLTELRHQHAVAIDTRRDAYTRDADGELVLKASVDAMMATPGGSLTPLTDMASELVALERPQTVLGRLNHRRVPFATRFPRVDNGATVRWTGQGLAKPVTKIDFSTVSLTWSKIDGIVAFNKEAAISPSVVAQALIGQEVGRSIATFMDTSFLDPSLAAIPDERPASITYGIPQVISSGTTIANAKADAEAALSRLSNANISLQNAVWIMTEMVGAHLGMMQDTAGSFVFPGISAKGGSWFGLPVLTSNSVQQAGSPTESFIVLLDGQSIAVADDGGATIDITKQAAIAMDDDPNSPAQLVSLWQQGQIGVKVEREVNWVRRRDEGVGIIANVAY